VNGRGDQPTIPLRLHFDFFFGIFAPDLRASLSAIATACFFLVTFFPLPDFSVPSLCSCITFPTFDRPFADFVAAMF